MVNFAYSAIPDREKLVLPDNSQIAVWLVINVENWYLETPARSILSPPSGVKPEIDVPNFTWHDYGMRIGFWRIRSLLQNLGFKATVALNGSVCSAYPRVANGCKDAGWEIMGHGFTQRILPTEPDEESAIVKTRDAIHSFFGTRPRGWLGPGLAETKNTLNYLSKSGYDYVCDWTNDDQPYKMDVDGKTLYSIPYTLELNDIVLFANQHFPAEEFYDRVVAQFNTMYDEGEENPRVMCIAVHPYISGVPHRIRILEKALRYVSSKRNVWISTGSEILDSYVKNHNE